MLTLQKTGLTLAGLSAVVLLTSATHAQTTTSITVNNFSFENPSNTVPSTYQYTPPGWTYNGTQFDTSGTYATGIQSYATATNGFQYAFINPGGTDPSGKPAYDLEQNTGFTTTVGDTYTLMADALTQDAGVYARIELTDGNGSYFSKPVTGVNPFATQTVTFTALPGTKTKSLIIDLLLTDANGATTVKSGQVDYDNIRLTQIAPAPEPAAWASLAVGALGLGALSLRARRRTPCA